MPPQLNDDEVKNCQNICNDIEGFIFLDVNFNSFDECHHSEVEWKYILEFFEFMVNTSFTTIKKAGYNGCITVSNVNNTECS